MRFGKKLAIMMEEIQSKDSKRPFISHRILKDLLSSVVRSLRNSTEVALIPSKLLEFQTIIEADFKVISSQAKSEKEGVELEILSLRKDGFQLGVIDSSIAIELIASIQNV